MQRVESMASTWRTSAGRDTYGTLLELYSADTWLCANSSMRGRDEVGVGGRVRRDKAGAAGGSGLGYCT